MANLYGIVGPSGSGKTTSTRNLNSDETAFVNTLGKPLPFAGFKTKYNETKKNILVTDNYAQVIKYINYIDKKATHVKNLILDDLGFIMSAEFFQRANEAGYNKFSDIGAHMQNIITTAKNCREDLNIIFLWHRDDVVSDGTIIGYKIRTIGRLLDDKWTPAALFTVLLYTHTEHNKKDNSTDYFFVTNRFKKYPAKSPMGMFEGNLVPNDLAEIIARADDYYS